jgi:CDP-4-dehydro-6-deoxyglucose reductase
MRGPIKQPGVLMSDERSIASTAGDAVIERVRIRARAASDATDDEGRHGVATVLDKRELAADIMQLTLHVDSPAFAARRPGQYLTLLGEDGSPRHFSIASPPDSGPRVELHVRRVAGGMFTSRLFDGLPVGSQLYVSGPFGDLVPRDGAEGMLLVAGGSGFAPMQAIAAHVLSREPRRAVTLLWSVRRPEDLYKRDMLEAWTDRHAHFRFLPVIDAGVDTGAGSRLRDRLAVLATGDQAVYLSGPPPMVALCRDTLAGCGVAAARIHHEGSSNGDVSAWAAR